jgi:hypothetical protein
MIATLVLAGLVAWPMGGTSVPGQTGGAISSGASKSSYHWVQPAPDPVNPPKPWPFYGTVVGPRDIVCWPQEWVFIGKYRALYPGVCWSRRAYLRMP